MLLGAIWISLQVRLVILVDIHRPLDVPGITSLLFILLPAVLAVFYGAKVLETASKVNITRSIGSSLCCVALLLPGFFNATVIPSLYDDVLSRTGLLLSEGVVALLLYVLLCKAIMQSEGIAYSGPHELFSRPFSIVISILFTISIVAPILYRFLPLDSLDLFSALCLISAGTVLSGWCFYLCFVSIVGIQREAAQDSTPKHA